MTENFEKIQELIHKHHHWTINELADTTEFNYGVCQEILTKNLIMHCTASPSWQRAHPHVPVTTTWLSFPILLTHRHSTLSFCFVFQIENETEGTKFWNGVWHPKGTASNTQWY
jgi:hypothetical protein